MSKVAIQGNASGTGTFTIQSPATNTDRALTLPDEAGTVLTSASDIESQVKTATNATGSAPIYACRAWVNFNGTGTVAIRASGNVSSITDNGTGSYNVNFATAMPDNQYSFTHGASYAGGNGFYHWYDNESTTSCQIALIATTNSYADSPHVSATVHR